MTVWGAPVSHTKAAWEAPVPRTKRAGEGEAAGHDGVAVISAPGSAIPVLVIPTDEEQAIARLTWELTRG